MKNRLIAFQERLRTNYWFIPAIMSVIAIFLSILTIKLDEAVGPGTVWITNLTYIDSPEGARAVLSTVANSMITVAGVVFSLTMVVLSLTSQQYGPLVLGHFMRDRGNQFVLGIFTSTYLYCLLILRTVHGVETTIFVPHISVLTGLGMSILSLAFLIYFIHHVSESIQSANIIDRVSDELQEAIEELFPAQVGQEIAHSNAASIYGPILQEFEERSVPIQTHESGYLQMIDDEALMRIACEYDIVLQLVIHPGQFLLKGQPFVQVLPPERITEDLIKAIQDTFILGHRRTQTQDVEFMFTQLSAIAVRALSPAINDPYTAIMCVDRLSDGLRSLLLRQTPSNYRHDKTNQLRVIADPFAFDDLIHTAYDQILHYGRGDIKVLNQLLKVIQTLTTYTHDKTHLTLLKSYAELIYQKSQASLSFLPDQQQVAQVYARVQETFQP